MALASGSEEQMKNEFIPSSFCKQSRAVSDAIIKKSRDDISASIIT